MAFDTIEGHDLGHAPGIFPLIFGQAPFEFLFVLRWFSSNLS